jgi:sugar phosphate isomerase/epimerase
MKIGFSTRVCPQWDLGTVVTNAAKWGFDGIELHTLRGESHLPLLPELAADTGEVRRLFADNGVECVGLSTSATLGSRNRRTVAEQKGVVIEFAELAAQIGAPYVRLGAGTANRLEPRQTVLARIAEELSSLAAVVSRLGVTLLIENDGTFRGSAHMWYLIDAVGHTAVRCCWNQCHAMTVLEGPTRSIPRLGSRIGLVHLCDASIDSSGTLIEHKPLGQGDIQIARQIDLLRGVMYDRYLMVEWPGEVRSFADADSALPDAAAFLKETRDAEPNVLSAYKGDKYAVKMAERQVTR